MYPDYLEIQNLKATHPVYKDGEWEIRGPYLHRGKGRRFLKFYKYGCSINSKKLFVSNFVMECHLQRELTWDDDVHHKDGDKLNDRLDNLQLLSHKEHTMLHDNLRIQS